MTANDQDGAKALKRIRMARVKLNKRLSDIEAAETASRLWKLTPQIAPPDSGLGTMAVSSDWELFVSPDFVASLSEEELITILFHELYHMLRQDGVRTQQMESLMGRKLNDRLVNIIQDVIINESMNEMAKKGKIAITWPQDRRPMFASSLGLDWSTCPHTVVGLYRLLDRQDRQSGQSGQEGDQGQDGQSSDQDSEDKNGGSGGAGDGQDGDDGQNDGSHGADARLRGADQDSESEDGQDGEGADQDRESENGEGAGNGGGSHGADARLRGADQDREGAGNGDGSHGADARLRGADQDGKDQDGDGSHGADARLRGAGQDGDGPHDDFGGLTQHGSGATGKQAPWEPAPAKKDQNESAMDTADSKRAMDELAEKTGVRDEAWGGGAGIGTQTGQARVGGRHDKRTVKIASTAIWSQILHMTGNNYARHTAGPGDWTYTRRSRNQHLYDAMGTGAIMPGMIMPRVTTSVILDVSISMSQNTLLAALGEVETMIGVGGQAGMTVTGWDTEHKWTKTVRLATDLYPYPCGGTDMAAAIEWIGAGGHFKHIRQNTPEILVVLTDCQTGWPERRPRGLARTRVVVGGFYETEHAGEEETLYRMIEQIPAWIDDVVAIPVTPEKLGRVSAKMASKNKRGRK